MKNNKIFIVALLIFFTIQSVKGQVFFEENFEQGIPITWTQQFVSSTASWRLENGGLNGEYPDTSYTGNYNVLLQQAGSSKITRLITPVINLSDIVKGQLRFGLAMTEYVGVDELTVECRPHPDSAWVEIAYFNTVVPVWTDVEIQIPDSLATQTTAIAFKGKTNYGGGICLDKIQVVENGLVSLFVKSVEATNFTYPNVPSGSANNPILRVVVNVVGNTGLLNLTNINFVSKNTDDTDIESGGLSLYYSKDTLLTDVSILATGKDFVGGNVEFNEISRPLNFGRNVFWLTYNLTNNNSRNRHNHILDAKVEADGIGVGSATYPYDELDPAGYQLYKEALVFDDFEDALFWTLNGDFDVSIPEGRGAGSNGNPDPDFAVSTVNVLGNDLSDDGLYENDLPALASVAESKYVNIDYYKDISINFWRWLNVDYFDDVSIGARRNTNAWGNVWVNNNYNRDNFWSVYNYGIHDSLSYRDSLQVRFTLGPTDEENNQSGWNIDNFSITGNYISQDVGVIALLEPFDGCGHTSETQLSIQIKNYGGESIPLGVPIRYSINGNSWVTEVAPIAIPLGGVADYTFTQTADLSLPGAYTIRLETALGVDEVADNNRIVKIVNVSPTYGIPYSQNFENGLGYWKTGGRNSTWVLRRPHQAITYPYIDSAYSGQYCWVTNFEGSHLPNDSSFLQSPCFDLSSSVAPILEFAIFTDFQTGVDGANVQYSIDNGMSWNLLPTNAQYNLNWYSNPNVTALDNPGWDLENSGWFVARNLIPDFLLSSQSIKFRIVVESDNAVENEGVAIDMVRIYEAPLDVAISGLNYPDTDCEIGPNVTPVIELRNDGVLPIASGTIIPVSVYFNNQFIKTDNIQLSTALEPQSTALYNIDASFYMDTVGSYNFRFINKYDPIVDFYQMGEDTLIKDVSVIGMPQYNPFTDITGKSGLYVELDAGTGYSSYNWSTGTTDQIYQAFVSATYTVTVTSSNGCTATDETLVVNSVDDIEITQILSDISDECVRTAPVTFEIELANRGGDSFLAGEYIPVGFQIEGQPKVIENIILSADFEVDDIISYTFTTPVDLYEPANYKVHIFSSIPEDLDKSNDTIIVYPNTWGIPQVAFAVDTIYTSNIDTLFLHAGAGMDSYLWQDASSQPFFDVISDVSQWYYVTIDDIHGCGPTHDSVFVNTDDIGLELLLSPTTACENGDAEQLVVTLQNYSGNVLQSGTIIPFGVSINGGAIIQENHELINSLLGNTSTTVTLETTYNFADSGDYHISVWNHSFPDNNFMNDSIHTLIRTKGYPDVDLLCDTIYTLNPDTLFFDAGTQFATYLWQNGATTPYFEPNMDTSFVYAVTVSNDDGCGYDSDSVQVFTYNLQLTDIVAPVNACELSDNQKFNLRVKNNGPDKLYPGDVYTLSYRVDGGNWIAQQFTVSSTVGAGSDFIKEIATGIDMSEYRRYNIEAALFFEHDASFGNDSIQRTIETYGYPDFSFNYDQINSTQPDTIVLIVTPPDFVNYSWNVGVNNDTLSLDTLNEPYYAITVSDVHGCATSDSVWVNARNIGFGDILLPANDCQHSATENIMVRLYNTGTDTIELDQSVNLNVLQPAVITESFSLTEDFAPGDSLDYIFVQTVDLNQAGEYQIVVSLDAQFDVSTADNQISATVETYGDAVIELGNEITINELPYVLDAGDDYASYLWHDGSTGSTFEIDESNITGTGFYSLTVTNDLGCAGSDSRRVHVEIVDWAAEGIIAPESGCADGQEQTVIARISNQSSVPVRLGKAFYIAYTINGDDQVSETFTLVDSVYPEGVLQHMFNQGVVVDPNVGNEIELRVVNGSDINADNNSTTHTFIMYEPNLEFNQDSIKPEAFPYTLIAPNGFETYVWSHGATGQSIIVEQEGWYFVDAYDSHGCFDTDSVFVDDPIGMGDFTPFDGFTIYPNPAQSQVSIFFNYKVAGIVNVEFLDMSGVLRMQQKVDISQDQTMEFDITDLPQGIFLVKVRSQGEVEVKTFIVQH